MFFQKNNAIISASVVSVLMLYGCGGGSSSDNKGAASTAAPASGASSAAAPAPTSAAAPSATGSSTPLPTAASSPTATSSPAAIGEALPSLSSPQAGSTATTGTGAEGIWTSTSGADHTIAFIDPQNNVSSLYVLGTTVLNELHGVISTTATSWTLTSGFDFQSTAFVYPVTSGNGTYTPKQNFTGNYFADGSSTNISWNYDAANALSVTQQSVTGTWVESGSRLTIANDGSFLGTLSDCAVSGTLLLTTAGTNQNLYTLTFSAMPGTSCAFPPGLVGTGSAAIVFLPMPGSTAYVRTIAYSVKAPDNQHIAYGQLIKQ